MKLEPVYLVVPEPDQQPVLSRRTWLAAGGLALGGVILGFGAGYSIGSAASEPEPVAPQPPAPESPVPTAEPALHPRVAWARRLAGPATPLQDLLDNDLAFLGVLQAYAPDDTLLWRGVARLCEAAADDPQLRNRRVRARLLLDLLRSHTHPSELRLQQWIPALERASRR